MGASTMFVTGKRSLLAICRTDKGATYTAASPLPCYRLGAPVLRRRPSGHARQRGNAIFRYRRGGVGDVGCFATRDGGRLRRGVESRGPPLRRLAQQATNSRGGRGGVEVDFGGTPGSEPVLPPQPLLFLAAGGR